MRDDATMPHAPELTTLTGFQRDLLFVVAGLNDPNGLEIKEELESYYLDTIRHGRLYPNLDTLVETGFITKGKYDERTNKYGLTEHGRTEVQARLGWQLGLCPPDLIAEVLPADPTAKAATDAR